MQSLDLTSIEQVDDGIICNFGQTLSYDTIQPLMSSWLKQNGFISRECTVGADRMSWRLDVEQAIVWVHFDELSKSCWFDQASDDLLAKLKQIVENN
ncbi:hypothetical protein DS2_13184 [Catenovulum agarivorans DS-2]|uniref:DUF3630 family protein n=1 Tax=Catenovulum agarivorans DS-2 TaxID=1328313 RepID=W7QN78_9ALTE|nr:DUF3630 family protein [Catenovulum agarivorans]EWH09353.1 hypothetical protein DS2_13184 [Catenovulum agarivorans DS-2]